MLVGDAMDGIVDELAEDEITEESGKLYLFVRYLDKTIMIDASITTMLKLMFHCKYL
jgi:hypothetical protein